MTLTLDSPKLRELTRAQIQSLAKKEAVLAAGKSEDIVRRLIQKYPTGVPIVENSPSTPLASPKQNPIGKSNRGVPPPAPIPEASSSHVDQRAEDEPVVDETSPAPSSSTEALEQLLYPDDEPAGGPSNASPGPSRPAGENQADDADINEYEYETGAPTHYMVVDTLRQFTKLVNAIPFMETRIAENRCLLKRAEALLDKGKPEARELAVTREYLEVFLLGKMKTKRELWDGTRKMKKKDRKIRMAWLRAERKADSEQRWREANEFNARFGLEPEPFSAFAVESDEEIIDSLLTTPASSRSGSSKRSREECGDALSDEHMHDASPRRKTHS